MVREEGVSSLGRGMTPNVFRAILMNASQLASYVFVPRLPFAVDTRQVRRLQGRATQNLLLPG